MLGGSRYGPSSPDSQRIGEQLHPCPIKPCSLKGVQWQFLNSKKVFGRLAYDILTRTELGCNTDVGPREQLLHPTITLGAMSWCCVFFCSSEAHQYSTVLAEKKGPFLWVMETQTCCTGLFFEPSNSHLWECIYFYLHTTSPARLVECWHSLIEGCRESHKTLIWVSSHSIPPIAHNSTQIAHCSGERQEYIGQGELVCVGSSMAMKTPSPAG